MDRNTHVIWAEKYRPSSLEAFALSTDLSGKLKEYISTNEIPHLLFYGPPGTGKTSLAMFLASILQADTLHINASDESGIDIVRNKIRPFAETLSFSGKKIVILDEFERMSSDAQDALRSLMEMHSDHTRFILTTNYIEKVTDPIRSRCQEFQINTTERSKVGALIWNILNQEGVSSSVEDISVIVNTYHPDIRKCINETQKCIRDNSLDISLSAVADSGEFEESVINLLSDKSSKQILTQFRELVAIHNILSFEPLYRALYNWIEVARTTDTDKALMYIIIAEATIADVTAIDKEIIATSCISKLISL